MAWRAIQDTVGMSESLAGVSDLAERLYWRLLAHSDQWGRLDGKPRKLRAKCYPLLSVSDEDAAAAVGELEFVGRVQLYVVDGEPFVQIVDFEANQPREAFRKRSGTSKFPQPPLRLIQAVSGEPTEPVRNGSGPEGEEKETETTPPASGGVLVAAGWTFSQQQQAVGDEPRAFAWVTWAKAQPDTLSIGARSWDGFKGGGWPEKVSKTVAYTHQCPHCPVAEKGPRALAEHIHVMHPELETVPA